MVIETYTKKPGLFEGTAWYYSRYRLGYPSEALDALVNRFGLDNSTPVLDLGCGTGQIALPLAVRGIPVHAVDPEMEMLAVGMRAEQLAGAYGIAWMPGSDKTIEQLPLPKLTLCAMGASFHWMDRDFILQKLNRLIVENGGVAILNGTSVWSDARVNSSSDEQTNAWSDVVKEVIIEFLGPERRAGAGIYQQPQDRHEMVLARSPFACLEKLSFVTTHDLTIEQLVGLQLSTSYASPAQLGNRVDEFKEVLSERLLNLAPSGVFHSKTTTEVLIATCRKAL
jgi:ubiquinone/menaquinone biosynthesis C-methylase UbiE